MSHKRKFVGNKPFVQAQPATSSYSSETHDKKDKADNSNRRIKALSLAEINVKLIKAAEKGYLTTVEDLLNQGANINAEDESRTTALMQAAKKGHLEVVRLLLKRGARIEDHVDNSALDWAAYAGRLDVVKLLLDNSADIKAQDEFGNTALFNAARKGHFEVVRTLLEHGASVIGSSNPIYTTLTLPESKGYTKIVDMLFESIKDLSVHDIVELAVVEKRNLNHDLAKRLYDLAENKDTSLSKVYYGRAKVNYLEGERDEAVKNYLIATHLSLHSAKFSMHYDTELVAQLAAIRRDDPESVNELEAVHPDAPLLLLDPNTPRHIAHALIDLDTTIPDSDHDHEHLAKYEALLQFGANSVGVMDETYSIIENTRYYPEGIAYLLSHLAWDHLNTTTPSLIAQLYSSAPAAETYAAITERKSHATLRQALHLLHKRGINLAWLRVQEPYIQLQQECKRLAEDPVFSSTMARYVEETGNLPRSLKIFGSGPNASDSGNNARLFAT